MLKKFVGLILLGAGLVACGNDQASIESVEDQAIQTASAEGMVCYKVKLVGEMTIVDDDFPRDDVGKYNLATMPGNYVDFCEGQRHGFINMKIKHGNEMRVEIHVVIKPHNIIPSAFSPHGEIRMYEGLNNNTNDLDGKRAINNLTFKKENGFSPQRGRIDSKEWNDDSRVIYNFSIKSTRI